ncbi:hypothetical protein TYRP_006168 [Tyrophagus putrescentiae]|nr:hypothetical protein TYRP_006168 [Tyrophagus putrescentiae]
MATKPRLTVITGNLKKLDEIVSIIGRDLPFEIVHEKVDLPEYQGELEFIVSEKCRLAAAIVGGPVLVEDTSLCIDALDGMPGPYVKWFIDSIGSEGIYRMVKDWEDKSATAVCMAAFCDGGGSSSQDAKTAEVHVFRGTLTGQIIEPRGSGFGFPCFLPDGHDRTLAQMAPERRNRVSHRYLSLNALRRFLLLRYGGGDASCDTLEDNSADNSSGGDSSGSDGQ